MKKNNLTILSVVFLGLNILFSIVYDLYYTFGYDYGLVKQNMGMASLIQIVPWILTIVSTVLLIIGVLKQNKILFCITFSLKAFYNFAGIIIGAVNFVWNEPVRNSMIGTIFSNLSDMTLNLFMLTFILIVFSWKEKAESVTYYVNNPVDNNSEFNTDILIEYKKLLDSGAITQEEFDKKKKELL